jgi:hypothetical protein
VDVIGLCPKIAGYVITRVPPLRVGILHPTLRGSYQCAASACTDQGFAAGGPRVKAVRERALLRQLSRALARISKVVPSQCAGD